MAETLGNLEDPFPITPYEAESSLTLDPPADRWAGWAATARGRIRSLALRPAALPVAVAAGAGAVALAGSFLIFPLLSDNNDEAVYLLQAQSLRDGRLFPPAPKNWRSFMPALSVWRNGHYVPKYTPLHAGIIALSSLVAGTPRAALPLIAGLAVATCYLLAKELLRSRKSALFAAIFFALSPLTVIQSATYLSYLSALAILQGFAAALLAGVRKDSPWLLWLSGFLAGAALFARPYDTVLFGLPFGLWLLWSNRKALPDLGRRSAWIAAGAALPLATTLAYFHASTGSWFHSPFNLIHPSDTVGFGVRRMYPRSRATFYTPALAWTGMREHLRLMGSWCFGGVALAVLAAVELRKRSWREPAPWVALILVTVPLGYFFFWGSYGSIRWSAPFRLGPYYYIGMLTPLCIFAGSGFTRLANSGKRLAALLAAGMLVLSSVTIVGAIADNERFTDIRENLYGPLLSGPPEGAIVFLPRLSRISTVTHPFALARNPTDYSGKTLWALDLGPQQNEKVLEEFPGRAAYRLFVTSKKKVLMGGKKMIRYTTALEKLPDVPQLSAIPAAGGGELCTGPAWAGRAAYSGCSSHLW